MDNRNTFEDNIKAKLEEISAVDTDKAWRGFAPLLTQPKVPIWKHWLMPYAYATTLFFAALAIATWTRSGGPAGEGPEEYILSKTDTLSRIDTIYLVDTVYIYKTTYVEESQTLVLPRQTWDRNRSSQGYAPDQAPVNGPEVASKPDGSNPNSTAGSTFPMPETEKNNHPELEASRLSAGLENPSESLAMGGLAATQSNPNKIATGISENPSARTLAAPSLAPKEEFVMKVEQELVVGDTSNLRMTPQKEKTKPMLHVELGASVLFPISRLVEYYTPIQPGVMAGLEWENGWGVYTGAIRSQIEGEIDDEEIATLDPSKVRSFPNVPQDIDALDEMYFINRQWFFPLEVRWRSLYYGGFSFESNLGIMANYLHRQHFTYEFEISSIEEYAYGASYPRQFGISHMRAGIGTNYLHSKRLGFYLRSQYWFPLSGTGLLNDRMHGLEVGAGINLFIGK
jgi:hypothetical protein